MTAPQQAKQAALKRGTGPLFLAPDVDGARAHFGKKGLVSKNRLMPAAEAVRRFVHDGDYLASGGFGTNRIATALLHEILRQGKKNLGLAGHTMTHDFQLLCAGECISRCDVAYIVGLEARGLSPNARRLVEGGQIELCEWTNASLAWRFRAAAMGVSFLPARVMLGTDTFEHSAAIEVTCPFTGQKYAALPALYPDVALIHVHTATPSGDAIIEGLTVADIELAQASKHVIISAEEIVPEEELRMRPHRITIPSIFVDAVVEAPFGSYPGNMPYRYFSDEEHLAEWLRVEKDPDEFKTFLDTYIYGCRDFSEYLNKCGGLNRIVELRRQEYLIRKAEENGMSGDYTSEDTEQ
jgi:glutaconate CoA-transferase subunit A